MLHKESYLKRELQASLPTEKLEINITEHRWSRFVTAMLAALWDYNVLLCKIIAITSNLLSHNLQVDN